MWTKLFRCSTCKRLKGVNKFYKHRSKLGHQIECKECQNLRTKKNYKKRKNRVIVIVEAPKRDSLLIKLAIAWAIGLLLMGWVVGYLLIG